MAKSLRSKKRRKMRNQKRIKWAPKFNARLQRIAKALNSEETDITQLVTVKTATEIKKSGTKEETSDGHMDIDVEVKSHDPKTLLDENGHYPEWMNQRAIKKHKQKFSKTKKVKKKVHKKKGEW